METRFDGLADIAAADGNGGFGSADDWSCSVFRGDLRALLPGMRQRAIVADADGAFPVQDMEALRGIGALLAPFPAQFGGLGLGTSERVATDTSAVLQALGYAHVAIGRLYEAHVNAARLIVLYGTPAQQRRASRDAAAGYMIGLWVTDTPGSGLQVAQSGALSGGKSFCSGAGYVTRALVTAKDDTGGDRLLYLAVPPERATPLPNSLRGVRCAGTGQVDFSGLAVDDEARIGAPGDYLREPAFSAGAWRTSAVTAGCLTTLVDRMIDHLAARGRTEDPHQLARIGRAWIARETAQLWLRRTAPLAERNDPADAEAITAAVHFGRSAIEACCMEALALAERSVGLQIFLQGTEIERLHRDLSTYLRQPAFDEVLGLAARHAIGRCASGATGPC